MRSQPHRLIWPLTPHQVEGVDEMLQILFKSVHDLEARVEALPTSTVVVGSGGLMGPPGADGEDGEAGFPGLRGLDGAPGAAGADGAPGGPPGPIGLGLPGMDGVDGEDGWPGATGPVGPAGAAGTDGVSGWTTVATKAIDQDVTNSTALVDATGLAITVDSGQVWLFQLILVYSGSATADDFKLNYTFPSSGGWHRFIGSDTTADAIYLSTGVRIAPARTSLAASLTMGTDAANTKRTFFQEMMLVTAGAGNVQVQFAQNSASVGNNARVHAGSIFRGVQVI